MAYIGKSPGTGVRNRFIYTATSGQTTFSGSDDHSRTLSYTDAEFTDVFLNGVKLDKSDYTATSGTSIVLGSAASVDDILEVLAFDTFSVFSGNFSQDVTVGADLTVDTNTLKVDSTNDRVGIGTSSPSNPLTVSSSDEIVAKFISTDATSGIDIADNTSYTRITNSDGLFRIDANDDGSGSNTIFTVATGGTERMRIDSSGDVGIGTSNPSQALQVSGAGARIYITAANEDIDMTSTADGQISIDGNGYAGGIALNDQGMNIYTNTTTRRIIFGLNETERFRINTTSIAPSTDNTSDLGSSTKRFDDVYATNGTIQTSDQNEKQQIASLTDAEITAAKAISKLFKTFKWNDKVEAKGDDARTHTGVVAQEVQQAMTDAGLDATKYAFWCSDTWLEFEGKAYEEGEGDEEAPEGATERTRLGIRYPELIAFIGAATEQRLTNIETRLTALEAN